jgi:predicted RNA binding protein YcfA (HicA-like mRNA interferase family)
MTAKQVIKILEKSGWVLRRINGSHHVFNKNNQSVSIPVYGNKDLGIGLLKCIEKQTGVELR